jgi:hypothetical protein
MIITEIYEELRGVGIVKSKYDFSQYWLGRCQSYTTAIEASGREASADALATLHTRLGALVAHMENAQQGTSWRALSAQRATLKSVHGRLREHLVERWYQAACGRPQKLSKRNVRSQTANLLPPAHSDSS